MFWGCCWTFLTLTAECSVFQGCWFGTWQQFLELLTGLYRGCLREEDAEWGCGGLRLLFRFSKGGHFGHFRVKLLKWQLPYSMRKRLSTAFKKMMLKLKSPGFYGKILHFSGCWDHFCKTFCLSLNKIYCRFGPFSCAFISKQNTAKYRKLGDGCKFQLSIVSQSWVCCIFFSFI